MFNAIMIEKDEAGYRASLKAVDESQLPEGDVTVRVSHSTLNYKDGLAITGKGPVVRKFPMVPGVDLVGTVEESSHPSYRVGDAVLLNGWGVGEGHWGGLAQKARLKGDWLVPLPPQFTPLQAMAIGTAGYTAMLCVLALEHHGVTPDKGEILVTGAAGGVGSVAVSILAKLGYTVVGVTGRLAESDYIKSLGASEVLERSVFSSPGKPLGRERLGRCRRCRRRSYPGQCLRHDQISRRRDGLRPGGRDGLPRDCRTFHPAWSDAGRH